MAWYNRFVTDYLQDPKWGCYENFDMEWFSKKKDRWIEFSELTGKLLDVGSRLQTFFALGFLEMKNLLQNLRKEQLY